LEYDIPVFFTIKTGAEGLMELVNKIDLAALIVSLREEKLSPKDKDISSSSKG